MGLREKCEIKKASIHAGLRAKTLYESQMLSSQGRYNHFDTTPEQAGIIITGAGRKSKGIFRSAPDFMFF